jgi:multicomponent Na+:H+ antiporter subunit B
MIEIYLRLVDTILTPVLMMLAILLFLRGHDYPGGGFIAGLTVAAAIELHILARGAPDVRRRLGHYLLPLAGAGLLIAVSAAFIGLYAGGFFKGLWIEFYFLGLKIKLGTPQMFDLGVMLVVIGMAITFLLNLSERGDEEVEDQAAGPDRPSLGKLDTGVPDSVRQVELP